MPELVWDETDFTTWLGAVPEVAEYGVSYHYRVQEHGLRLEVTVYPHDSDIYITVWREGLEDPVIDLKLLGCSGVRYVNDQRGEYLEVAPGQVYGDRFEKDFVIPVGLRLSVKPSISLRFF